MKLKKKILRVSLFLLALAFPIAISAHDMWIGSKDFKLAKGSVVEINYPSDHAFPPKAGEYVAGDKLAPSYIISPAGARSLIVSSGKDTYKSAQKLDQPGTYLIVSGKKWSYWTKTAEGYQEGKNKKQVKGAIKSMYSGKFCKALVTVEKAGGSAFSKVVGHELEIVPLKDPGSIGTGGDLPIKVLFKGKPVEIEVKATYEGFSTEKSVFAVTFKTDSQGRGIIKDLKAARWLVVTGLKEKPKNNELCDDVAYSAALTFQAQ